MPEFSRILCAVDVNDASRRGLDCALWWARQHGADVSVLHVRLLTPPSAEVVRAAEDMAAPVPAGAIVEPPLSPTERSRQLLELETFVHERRTDGLQVEVLLDEDASLAGAILARADALAADLIVMGAGTGSISEHPVLSQVTTEVLRGAPCSLLVVPAPAPDVANPCASGLNRIMCAVSLSEGSEHALACAASLARQTAARLAVVHVVELFSEVAALAYDFDAHREARLEPACDELVDLVAAVVGHDTPVEEIVAQGMPSTEILKLADEESSGLIVVGHGRGSKGRGKHPAGQAIARDARCPVLFVHAEPAALSFQRAPALGTDAAADAASGAKA